MIGTASDSTQIRTDYPNICLFKKRLSSTILIILQKCNTCQYIFAWFINLFGLAIWNARQDEYPLYYTATFWTQLCLKNVWDVAVYIVTHRLTVNSQSKRNDLLFRYRSVFPVPLPTTKLHCICVRVFWGNVVYRGTVKKYYDVHR